MNWQIDILLQTLFAAISLITIRILAREKRTSKASFVINGGWYVFLYLTGLAFLPWLGPVHAHVLEAYWWRFLIGGLAFALTNVCTYKTLVYFDAALASIVGTVNAFFTVIGSALVLDEKLSAVQAIGGVILMWAISYGLLATRTHPHKIAHRAIRIGVMYALLAGLFYAVAIVNEKSLLGDMSLGSYMVFGWGGQMIISVGLGLMVQPQLFRLLLQPRIVFWSAISGIFRGLAGVCFMFSEVKSNNVGLVTIISNFRIIIVVLLGWWLLKERQRLKQKLISAAMSIGGLTVMFWH